MGGLFGSKKKSSSTPAPTPTVAQSTADQIETANGTTYQKIADANQQTSSELAPTNPTGSAAAPAGDNASQSYVPVTTMQPLETILPSKRNTRSSRKPGTLATQSFGYG